MSELSARNLKNHLKPVLLLMMSALIFVVVNVSVYWDPMEQEKQPVFI